MQIKVAVPSDSVYDFFYKNHNDKVNIIKTTEAMCFELLFQNRVNVALLTPLSYGRAVGQLDLRIIPGPALISYDYTKIASIAFGKGLRNIKSIASEDPENFIATIGKIIFAERYYLHQKITRIRKKDDSTLLDYSAFIGWGDLSEEEIVIDISEDWKDMSQYPLPLAFWVCRSEDYPDNIEKIVSDTADISANHIHISEENTVSNDVFPRTGKIVYEWNEDFEDALIFTMQMLFFHQLLPEMPAVKLLGRD